MPPAPNVLSPAGRRRLLRSCVAATAVAVATLLALAVSPGVAAAGGGTTVVGELVQAWPEVKGHHTAAGSPLSWVQTPAGESVRVPTEDLRGVPAGSTVSVTVGGEVSDTASQDGVVPARDVITTDVVAPPADPAPLPASITNQVTVVPVTPAGTTPDGVTRQQLVDTVDGPVADFWREETGGAIRVGVAASSPWITTTADCSDPNALWDDVAAQVHFVDGPGKHLLVYLSSAFANLPGCSYALGTVGTSPATGGRMYVSDAIPSVIAHELGHNFGLGHSSEHQCDGAVDAGTCRTAPYRDLYDVMGASWDQLGSLNAAQAARLGVLPAGQTRSLSVHGAAATMTLAPLSGRTGTRALRLTDASGADYWLEYRTASLRDGWLATAANRYQLQQGVLVHRGADMTDEASDTSLLLDGTPSTAASWDGDYRSALTVGSAVQVAGGQFTIAVEQMSAAGAVLRVTPAPPAAAGASAPASSAPAAGRVLPGNRRTGQPSAAGSDVPAGAPAASSAVPYIPLAKADGGSMPATPRLESAANTTNGAGLLVPLAGAVLIGGSLLGVRFVRRASLRAR